MTDPPTRYYLSPRRANVLRPFAGALGGRVLEVGAGLGSVTRFLGELGGQITAVEGTRRRAGIARARTRDLPNVQVVWEDGSRLETRERFDAVVLVGVLEYARVLLRAGADSQRILLSHLRGLLTEDGMLVLAIENQLGAKYWAGAGEDHYGAEFFGLQDCYDDTSVATFGRGSLSRILTEAGFPHQAWYVPIPDYKVPAAILSPAGLEAAPRIDAANLLAQNVFWDERKPARPRFSLEQVWSVLQRNGLLLEMANSFLVVAGPSPRFRARLGHDDLLAWTYAVDRAPPYAKESCTRLEGGRLMVRRRALAPEARAPETPLSWRLYDEPHVEGRNWWLELVAMMAKPGWGLDHLAAWARCWLAAVLQAAGADAPPDAGRPLDPHLLLPGRLVEATPLNLVRDDGGCFRFSDLEWELEGGVELGFLAYRALGTSLGRLTSVTWSGGGPAPTPGGLLRGLFGALGLGVTEADLERYGRLSAQLQAWAWGSTPRPVPAAAPPPGAGRVPDGPRPRA